MWLSLPPDFHTNSISYFHNLFPAHRQKIPLYLIKICLRTKNYLLKSVESRVKFRHITNEEKNIMQNDISENANSLDENLI